MPFQVCAWPSVVLHLDGDAFFVSVLQAINPSLKGKPVVAGSERGIATAVSYEAKKYGIRRAMRIDEVKKLCPQCIIMHSDYETYSLFSKKMFGIMREFSPTVEEYSIDEAFADLKGLRRPLNMTYFQIGEAIKNKIESSLGIPVSLGISLTKSLAKLASSSAKPSGLKMLSGLDIEEFLKKIPIENVWGIGENTAAYCQKLRIQTAFDLAIKDERFMRNHFSKTLLEIWYELRGEPIYTLDSSRRTSYKSIQRTESFRPTNSPSLLWAKLMEHVEDAFKTARRYKYRAGKISIFLKTQQFRFHETEIKFPEKTSYPMLVTDELKQGFHKIWVKGVLYRTTGCTIFDLGEEVEDKQQMLFTDIKKEEQAKKIYPLLETNKVSFASSLFDKERFIENKKKPRTAIPMLSLTDGI